MKIPLKLAVVSPCYNETDVINDSARRLTELFENLIGKHKIAPDSFVLYVNDGSKDDTWEKLKVIHHANQSIKAINLAHNVGHQSAIMAGMMTVRENVDAVITIDADLQDDLNAIEKMIDAHENGAEIVYGVKVSREADSAMKKLSAQMFYKLLKTMGVETIYNHADFRFMSRLALDILANYKERNLYLRGVIPQIGLKTATVDDVISPRLAGSSKYTLGKMLKLASNGVTAFSTRPIEMIIYVGLFMLLIALGMFVHVMVSLLTNHYTVGWASLMLSLWFVGAVLILAIGVVGTYIGKVFIEVKQRPLYSIAEKLM